TVGIATGMLGVVILVGPSVAIDRSLDPAGIVALIISPISWAPASLCSSNRSRLPKDPFLTTGMQMFAGSTVLAAASLLSGELRSFRVEPVTTHSLVARVYLTA